MNDSIQNSQGQNLPETKSQKLSRLISRSHLLMTGSAIAANLSQLTDIHQAVTDGNLELDTVHAVLFLTEQHLCSIDGFMDSAIGIYNCISSQYCKKMANDIVLAVQSFKFCTLALDVKGDFLYGLFLSALKLEESLYSLEDVIRDYEGQING